MKTLLILMFIISVTGLSLAHGETLNTGRDVDILHREAVGKKGSMFTISSTGGGAAGWVFTNVGIRNKFGISVQKTQEPSGYYKLSIPNGFVKSATVLNGVSFSEAVSLRANSEFANYLLALPKSQYQKIDGPDFSVVFTTADASAPYCIVGLLKITVSENTIEQKPGSSFCFLPLHDPRFY